MNNKKLGLIYVLVIGFSITACSDDNAVPSLPPPPPSSWIAGKWYASQEHAAAENANFLVYEFTVDQKILTQSGDSGLTYSIMGKTITTKISGNTVGTAYFSVWGTSLEISEASVQSGLVDGIYYKK
ncbi:MAG: hypothetical protein FWD36_06725 [Treponema sp.]|nr:hypothetical protein [Treponema sp.]